MSYNNTGIWPISAYADQNGNFSGSADVSATLVAGRIARGVSSPGVSLLIRIGIAGLALRLSGGAVQRADAKGDVFFTDL